MLIDSLHAFELRMLYTQSLGLEACVRQCATNLSDTELLAKLAAGDLIALEMKYRISMDQI